MAQPLSIEDPEQTYLITTKTAGSRLWLINNEGLERYILGALARYQEIHGVILYAFVIMGNHYHLLARFPNANRALFMRDFNSAVARLVGRYVKVHGRRSVWARRYSHQVVPRAQDIRHWFYYVGLNPVISGLVRNNRNYPSYNSFYDAASGLERTFSWIDWSAYLLARRSRPEVKPQDYAKDYTLKFSKLPDNKASSDEEYQRELLKELLERQESEIQKRIAQGKGFLGVAKLKAQAVGSLPKNPKTSTRYSFRPLVLTLCGHTKNAYLKSYFYTLRLYNESSRMFRNGNRNIGFPLRTYPPPLPLVTQE